jgi:hypothetical protein
LLNDFCAEPLFLFPKLTFLESDDEPLAIICIFVNKYAIMLIPKEKKQTFKKFDGIKKSS